MHVKDYMKRINKVGRLAKPMEMRIVSSRQAHTVMSTLKNSNGHSKQSIRASSHLNDGSRKIGGFESPSRHVNKGTRLIYFFIFCSFCFLEVDSELTPMSSPFKFWGMEMQSMSMQSPSWCGTGRNTAHIPYAYEPPLGENRDLGEILDSTLTQNPRLI